MLFPGPVLVLEDPACINYTKELMVVETYKAVVIPGNALCAIHAMPCDIIGDVYEAIQAHIRCNIPSTKHKTINTIWGFSNGIVVEARGGRGIGD